MLRKHKASVQTRRRRKRCPIPMIVTMTVVSAVISIYAFLLYRSDYRNPIIEIEQKLPLQIPIQSNRVTFSFQSSHIESADSVTISTVNNSETIHICVISRIKSTEDAYAVSTHITSFLAQTVNRYSDSELLFDLYCVNGDGGVLAQSHQSIIDYINDSRIHSVKAPLISRQTFGYEMTNYILNILLQKSENKCKYFLFTNGDNLYHRQLFETVHPSMISSVDLIAVAFVTHHSRLPPNGGDIEVPNLKMENVSFAEGQIDLGTVFVSRKAIETTNERFYAGMAKYKLWCADWVFFKHLIDRAHATTYIYPNTLFFHQ